MRKDLFTANSQNQNGAHIKTAFRVNLGIGLMMGIVAFGGMLGPSHPLQADPSTAQKRSLAMTTPYEPLPEVGLSSNEVLFLRDKAKQQDAKIAQLNKEIHALNSKVQELNRSLFAKDNALDNSKIHALHQKLQQKNRINAQLEQKIAALETKLSEIANKEDLAKVTVESLSEMIALLKGDKEKMYAQHLDELHQMQLLAEKEKHKLLNEFNADFSEKEKALAQRMEELNAKQRLLEAEKKQLAAMEDHWKTAFKQKKEELKLKEEDLEQLAQEHAMVKQDWEVYSQNLKNEIAELQAQIQDEKARKKMLKEELDTWVGYSDEVKQDVAALQESHEELRKALYRASYKAVEKEDDYAIAHALEAYRHQKALAETQNARDSIDAEHASLQTSVEEAAYQHQASREAINALAHEIQDLQEKLKHAYESAALSSDDNESMLIAVARQGSEKEDDANAERVLSALREQTLREEYSHAEAKLNQEADRRKALEEEISLLASQAEDREREIADWVAKWEQKVLQAEAERDAAFARFGGVDQTQQDLIDHLAVLAGSYSDLENRLEEEKLRGQGQIAQLQEQLVRTQEEAAHAKLELTLEKIALVIEKQNMKQSYEALASMEDASKALVANLETERDDALHNLAFAEERQNELLKQVEDLSQKYAEASKSLAQHSESSFAKEILLGIQSQELAESAAKLHAQLMEERENFNRHRQDYEAKQAELASLYEAARTRTHALENDLSTVTTAQREELDTALANLEVERDEALKRAGTAEEKHLELLGQVQELSQKLAALESEYKEHAQNSSASEDVLAQQIQELEGLSHKLQNELAEERSSSLQYRQEAEAKQAELSKLYEEASAKSHALDEELQAAKSSHQEELHEVVSNLEAEREDALQRLSSAEGRHQELSKELNSLLESVNQLDLALQHEKTKSGAREEELTSAIAAIGDERDAAIEKHQMSEKHKEELLTSIDQLRAKVRDLESRLTEESSKSQDVIQHVEKQLQESLAALDEMHENLQASEEEQAKKEQRFREQEEDYLHKIQDLEKELANIKQFIDEEQAHWNNVEKGEAP